MVRWIVCLALLAIAAPARADEIDELMDDGRWKEARTAVALEPTNADYRYQTAEVCGAMAQAAGKLKAFGLARRFKKEAQQAIVLDPAHIDARLGPMEFYVQAPGIVGGSHAKAEAMAKEILARDRARGLMGQASFALRAKDPAKAEGLYRGAVEANPAYYGARLGLARMLATDERKQGAEAEAQARAERYLRRYLEIEPEPNAPSHAHAQWRLAHALEKQERRAEAMAALETALKLNAGLEEAKKDLKRLKKG